MIQYKYLVCMEDVDGLPGLEVGDAVIPVASEVLPGGYEYRVWHSLASGAIAKTRIEHMDHFREFVAEGEDMDEVMAEIAETCQKIVDGRIKASL